MKEILIHNLKKYFLNKNKFRINKDFFGVFLIGLNHFNNKNIIIIFEESSDLNEIEKNIKIWKSFSGVDIEIVKHNFPVKDPFINNKIEQEAIIEKQRLLRFIRSGKRLIVLTTISSLNIKLEKNNAKNLIEVKINDKKKRKEFVENLSSNGYVFKDYIQNKGEISYRGSIVDVFPIDSEFPYRIEFEGDDIISIRIFNPETQISIKKVGSFSILSNRYFAYYNNLEEYVSNNKEMLYLFELINSPLIIFNEFSKCKESFEKKIRNFNKIRDILKLEKKNNDLFKFNEMFALNMEDLNYMEFNLIDKETRDDLGFRKFNFDFKSIGINDIHGIETLIKKGFKVYVGVDNNKFIEEFRLFIQDFEKIDKSIEFSFANDYGKYLILSEKNNYKVINKKNNKVIKNINEISVNDFVVHKLHGIGVFKGLETMNVDDREIDFLKIEYIGNEFLYVPVYDIKVLQKYTSFEGIIPKLDKLGGNTWIAKQKRAKRNIMNFAKELLELYALRKSIKGNSFVEVEEFERKLVDEFEYIETIDQKKAIEDVLSDLEKPYPMERLVCGDVSFGKTEVAVRAAFRVVVNSKQVVLLSPTTILANQHYNTFKNRLKNFPLNIKLLSRGVKESDKEIIYEDLSNGKIDILIGTHSILSDKVNFKNLGLIIIDEEQRFGVFQKEKLKKGREDVDVLILSATPIPRTLSFALSGLQDISLILTPPIGRYAIKNFVYPYSNEIIFSAVIKEMERDGLVYIVFNNINKIHEFKQRVKKILKDLPIAVIHAKMKALTIEKTIENFINKKIRVLISTTIIENGIDISEVNTLVVVNAEKFGLTQLYQLRGRIGRGSKQAYAYFLVDKENITEKAKSRLDAIKEFAKLGAGFKIAEFDLRLRGAGSLLGNKQHGHIEALGFDFYMELLEKTIRELKGESVSERLREIKYNFSYHADTEYFKDSSERISFYRRVMDIERFEELNGVIDELIDRYGYISENIDKIFYAIFIKILGTKLRSDKVVAYLDEIYFENVRDKEFLKNLKKFDVIYHDKGIKIKLNNFKDYKNIF